MCSSAVSENCLSESGSERAAVGWSHVLQSVSTPWSDQILKHLYEVKMVQSLYTYIV